MENFKKDFLETIQLLSGHKSVKHIPKRKAYFMGINFAVEVCYPLLILKSVAISYNNLKIVQKYTIQV